MTVADHRRSDRTAVLAEVLSVIGTVALVAWLPSLTRRDRWPVTALVAIAVLLGSSGVLIDLTTRVARARRTRAATTDSTGCSGCSGPAVPGTVTTVIVLGDEPPELQRHSVALAHGEGPCAVLATTEVPGIVADLGVPTFHGTTTSAALDAALEDIDTDAVLLLSARAVPIAERCRAVAGMLDRDRPWAVGRTRPFSHDSFAGDAGGRVGAGLRARADDAGLALWEPNATLVHTGELRCNGLPTHRPRGSWLRDRRAGGGRPIVVDRPLSLVAAPASARTFWPDSFAQQRGAAADAAAATRTEHGLARLLAVLFVARESFAWVVPVWLGVLLIGTVSGELPFRTAHGIAPALAFSVLTLRWFGLHRSTGVPLRPSSDIRSTIDRIPGSIAALPSILSGRVLSGPRRVSVRPLLWAAVLTVAVLATSLVDHPPDAPMTLPAVLAALATLVVLWGLCIQVLAQRGWERTTFRIPMSLPVRADGRSGRVVDGSPGGMAVWLTRRPDEVALHPGEHVHLEVGLDDATTAELDGQVVWSRRSDDRQVCGLTLRTAERTSPGERAGLSSAMTSWSRQLLRAATDADAVDATRHTTRSSTGPSTSPRSLSTRISDVVGIGLALLLSVGLLAVLGAAMLGLQVAVVRSASMTPTISQGSVVISESVRAGDIRPGDVVTRPGSNGHEPVTHRVVTATPSGDTITMATRGDANQTSETWDAPVRSTLQRVRWTVPSVGEIVAAARSNVTLALGAALLVGLLVLAVRMPRRAPSGTSGVPATS